MPLLWTYSIWPIIDLGEDKIDFMLERGKKKYYEANWTLSEHSKSKQKIQVFVNKIEKTFAVIFENFSGKHIWIEKNKQVANAKYSSISALKMIVEHKFLSKLKPIR